MNDTALRQRNGRTTRPEASDHGHETRSSLAGTQGNAYRETAQRAGKLADTHILKIWPRYLKTVAPAMTTPRSSWIVLGTGCRN